MESQPKNPEFRIYPENFHPCKCLINPPLADDSYVIQATATKLENVVCCNFRLC